MIKKLDDGLVQEPPPYTVQSTTAAPAYDHLDFTPSPLELPTATECIAHLKLLHAFARLRHEVGNTEGLYGINSVKIGDEAEGSASDSERNNIHQPSGVHGENGLPGTEHDSKDNDQASLAERVREKRWTVFVTKAVDRFEKWWQALATAGCSCSGFCVLDKPIKMEHFESNGAHSLPSRFPTEGNGCAEQIANHLPPLDVLMVWHTYMLNPRVYLEDCIQTGLHAVWRSGFPWSLLHDCIDNTTFEYTAPVAAKEAFKRSPSLPWDALKDPAAKAFTCPGCKHVSWAPYTRPPATADRANLEAYLTEDTGFAGQAFTEKCFKCGLAITHEKLRVGKFIDDAYQVRVHQRPLPGTILNQVGVPQGTVGKKKIGTHDAFFPNRVIEKNHRFGDYKLRSDVARLTILEIKNMFQKVMETKDEVVMVNSEQYKPHLVARESKIAVRKVLSHYWDNSSPFGLDLVGATLRQGVFVQKMAKINWIKSPSVMPTMQRLIVKYHRFIRIIANHPKSVAVPTLDVDLAWHTHQLTPSVYYKYSLAEAAKFINHDDKVAEASLSKSFRWTSTVYERKYGQPYSECACWYCETTREPMRSSFTNRVFRSSVDVDAVSEKSLPKDPILGPHISAHNALPGDGARSALERRRELELLDLHYAKVRKRYQKKKKEEEAPSRENDAYVYGAYGYPMYYPVYMPYYADPGCEHAHAGGGGGCAAGTCCDSASAGNCSGGSGTPGCSASCGGHGSAGGGCGSCGGGGGGGCGGGGGGGCGGGGS